MLSVSAGAEETAALCDTFYHLHTGAITVDIFLGNDGVAVIWDGTTCHEAHCLSGGDGAFVDDAGAAQRAKLKAQKEAAKTQAAYEKALKKGKP